MADVYLTARDRVAATYEFRLHDKHGAPLTALTTLKLIHYIKGTTTYINGRGSTPQDVLGTGTGANNVVFAKLLSPGTVIAAVSDGPDTRHLTIRGVVAGVDAEQVLTLNGTSEVVQTSVFTSVTELFLDGKSARAVTVKAGVGGATLVTIAANTLAWRVGTVTWSMQPADNALAGDADEDHVSLFTWTTASEDDFHEMESKVPNTSKRPAA